jgi:AbiTii
MTLLQEIQHDATGTDVALTVVLRKCRILAARLNHEPFSEWVTQELEGYPPGSDHLPSYRGKLRLEVRGTFAGPFGSGIENAVIPPATIKSEQLRDSLFFITFSESIGYYESLIGGDDYLRIPWPADVLIVVGQEIYEGQSLMAAWRVLPVGVLNGLLDQVRNRVLSFCLEIEKSDPAAGEAAPGDPPLPQAQVQHVFNTTIVGDRATVSAGGRDLTVNNIDVILPDGKWTALETELVEVGLPADEIAGLKLALETDGGAVDGELGPAAQNWIGKMTTKIATGVWPVATGASGGVVAQLVLRSLGLV